MHMQSACCTPVTYVSSFTTACISSQASVSLAHRVVSHLCLSPVISVTYFFVSCPYSGFFFFFIGAKIALCMFIQFPQLQAFHSLCSQS